MGHCKDAKDAAQNQRIKADIDRMLCIYQV